MASSQKSSVHNADAPLQQKHHTKKNNPPRPYRLATSILSVGLRSANKHRARSFNFLSIFLQTAKNILTFPKLPLQVDDALLLRVHVRLHILLRLLISPTQPMRS